MPFDLKDKFPGQPPAEADDFKIEPMFVNMGPSHPAMHGTIKILLKLSGEKVLWADVEIGYLHRAFEKTGEYKTWNQVIPYTDRLNYVSPAINNVGYAMAVEKLLGITPPPRCQYIRVILSELSRIGDHLTCLGASAMELGAMTCFLYFMKAREYLWQLTEEVTGARLTISYTRVGGVIRDLPANFAERFAFCSEKLHQALEEVEGMLLKNRIFLDRMNGTGLLGKERAISYGFTGPMLRATGVAYDVRKANPYLVYDQLSFEVPVGTCGDNLDRFRVRLAEMRESAKMIGQALDQIPEGPISAQDHRVTLPDKKDVFENIEALMNHFKLLMPSHGIRPPKGEVYFPVEGANGELGFWIISDGSDRAYRVRVRPPCFPPMSALEEMLVGQMVADIVPTFGMVNMIAGELER